jgi:DNA-binding winged helix-turn-helix (wHTH) protein
MDGVTNGLNLASEPDFALATLRVCPSACRIIARDQEARVEAKTMAVLVVLARAAGATVTRDELIDTCWGGRVISDDAIARTIAKVRSVSFLTTPVSFTLETVPKVGYRLLAADASSEATATLAPRTPNGASIDPRPPTGRLGAQILEATRLWLPVVVSLFALAMLPMVWGAGRSDDGYSHAVPRSPEVMDALMNLDQTRLAVYVERGWDPDWKLDSEGNAALHQVMMVCERHPTHDRASMVAVVRFLVESGADWTMSNGWGDDPLEISSAARYCGANHPVTAYLSQLAERTPPQLIEAPPRPEIR